MASLLAKRPRVDRSFERLYRRHVDDVYHYTLAVLRNPADAEDVTQTTFLNAYNAYRRGERPHSPRSWLIAIAHNVCRQRFRQATRRPQEVTLDQDVGAALVQDEDGPSAHDIRNALGQLAFNQRAALVMRELEGRSYAEIGELLGLTLSAVETLIFRARRAVREQLEGSLTCRQAERALSRQIDGRLARSERGPLRAHLRACPECASFARSQRAQRAALRSIATVPLPSSLASFFGGGGAATGTTVAAKAATVLAAGALVGSVGYAGVKRIPQSSHGNAAEPGSVAPVAAARPLASARLAVAESEAAPARADAARSKIAATRGKRRGSRREKGNADHTRPPSRHRSNARGGRHGRPNFRTSAEHRKAHGKAGSRGNAHGSETTKPKPPAPDAARPEQTGRSDPPGQAEPPDQGKKGVLPVTPPAIPALPPELPDPGKLRN